MDRVRNQISGTVNGLVVQAGTVALAGPPPAAVAGLPAQPVFVGRRHELGQLIAAIRPAEAPSTVVVCALGGLPGVGKTALAIRAGRLCERSGWFPGGVVMIDLHGYEMGGTEFTQRRRVVGEVVDRLEQNDCLCQVGAPDATISVSMPIASASSSVSMLRVRAPSRSGRRFPGPGRQTVEGGARHPGTTSRRPRREGRRSGSGSAECPATGHLRAYSVNWPAMVNPRRR